MEDKDIPQRSPKNTLPRLKWSPSDFIRLVSFVVTFAAILLILMVLSPLTLFHPFLRRQGWRDNQLPGSRIFMMACGILIYTAGIGVIVRKSSKPVKSNAIFMFTHASNLDPIIVTWAIGCSPKFVFKRELGWIPVFGWILNLYGHIPINRAKRDDAIASLKLASKNILEKNKSVAISPEGTRSKTGELLPFKRGPFHLAHECTDVPIVPVVLRGAFALQPPKQKFFHSGYVHVTILDPIPTGPTTTVDSLAEVTEKVIKDNLTESVKIPDPSLILMLVPFILFVFYIFLFVSLMNR